jgi:alpha-L-rhamnosidase
MPELAAKAEKLRKVIIDWSFNGEFFVDNAVRKNGKLEITENTTETCQYYAFYFDVATPETYPQLFQKLFSEFGASRNAKTVYPNVYKSNAFIGNFLRLDYLCRIGLQAQTVEQCREYFGFMAKRTGTLWEHDSTCASCNHGFASYVTNMIILGLTGFVTADVNSKLIYMTASDYKSYCKVEIPLGIEKVIFEVNDGKLSSKLPDGYQLVQMKRS